MGQNTSSAVMQQRKEPSDSFDYFPTPPWATRALIEYLDGEGELEKSHHVIEPACGQGFMSRPLSEFFERVDSYDIQDLGYGSRADYLWPVGDYSCDWTITNPPFRLAEQFINKALVNSRVGVAMFVRSSFTEGVGRYNDLWSRQPPSFILQFAERVPLCKGRVDPKIGSATSYAWIVWVDGTERVFDWIPPCRKRLEREGDYV